MLQASSGLVTACGSWWTTTTHWELVSLFHLLGDYQCFAWLLLFVFGWGCGVVLLVDWSSPLFAFRMHKIVIYPRLSPSSWWAQHGSKKKVPDERPLSFQYCSLPSITEELMDRKWKQWSTRRRISRKHWRQLNEDSWIKEMFDVSVDMSSVRKTFIPDIFLHQCCQHSSHNFSATPHHQHTNPTPATHWWEFYMVVWCSSR